MKNALPVIAALLAVLGAQAPAAAQAPADSIAAWTVALQSGTLLERVHAAGKLAGQDPATLPDATRAAFIAELDRVNEATMEGLPLEGVEALGGEGLGEYYLDLATTVASIDTPEARRALIPAVGTSRGAMRRVARLGDQAVPALSTMIDRDYEILGAYGALGLAWFWADSTGAPLSETSRATILDQMLRGFASADSRYRLSAASALRHTGDPGFLPLAERLEAVLGGTAAAVLRAYAIPSLETAAATAEPLDLARSTERLIRLLCDDPGTRARRGACASLTEEFAAAMAHLEAGRTGPASNVLGSVIRRADAALRTGGLTADEHALIAGGARQVLERI